MNSALLTTEELCQWFEVKQPARLARVLRERNITYTLSGKDQPITTIEAINASLKLINNEEVDF